VVYEDSALRTDDLDAIHIVASQGGAIPATISSS
jgi:hypothetical protein